MTSPSTSASILSLLLLLNPAVKSAIPAVSAEKRPCNISKVPEEILQGWLINCWDNGNEVADSSINFFFFYNPKTEDSADQEEGKHQHSNIWFAIFITWGIFANV